MKDKLLPIIVAMIVMALLGNTYRLHKKIESIQTPLSADGKRLQELEEMKVSWDSRENDLLNENAMLIIKCNELQQELDKKPLTIYKYKRNEKSPINRSASESITNLLSKRYIIE
jgi:predicted Holliday junction resolvase-like endonuclease